MKSKKKNITSAILCFGYAEEALLGVLFCHAGLESYSSKSTALKGLAQDLLDIYKEKYPEPQMKDCCEKFKNLPIKLSKKYCQECGTNLKDQKFDIYGFKEWLVSLPGLTNDQFGYHDYANGHDLNWEFGSSTDFLFKESKTNILIIEENAEVALCDALGLKNEQ